MLQNKPIKPLPKPLLPVVPFDYSLFPNGAIRDFIQDVTERMQCPPDYIAVSVMIGLSSIIGKSHQIEPKEHDNWTVVPNLWGVILGDPSQLKSPAVSTALKPIKNLEQVASEEYQVERQAYQQAMSFYEIKLKADESKAKKLIKAGDDLIAETLLEATHKIEPQPPIQNRYIINDATVEKLGELLNENPNGLLMYRDEFNGFLRNIESPQKPNDRSFYLEGWNGDGSYSYDRIGRGTIPINNMVISILGTIQPNVYASHIQRAIKQGSGDDGFSQRFQLSVYPDKPINWQNIDRKPDEAAIQAYSEVVQDLIAKAAEGNQIILKFDDDAQLVFNNWRDDLENNKLRDPNDHPTIIAHLAKYRSLMPSLALIIHLINHSHDDVIPAISKDAATLACDWCDYLESHARRIYSVATNNPIFTAQLILNKIRAGELKTNFSVRILQRKGWAGLTDNEEIRKGLDVLHEHNFIEEYDASTTGRPSTKYQIHPTLLTPQPVKVAGSP